MRVVQVRVSPMPFRPVFGHCFGAYATPGGRLVLLLCYAPYGYGFHLRWTHRKCRTSALGVAPTR